MLDGRKNIVAWFELTNMPYWIIYQRGKTESGNPSFRSDEREGVTAIDAADQLKKTLNIIGRGQYSIIASAVPKVTAKGTFREEFEISINENAPAAAPAAINGPVLSTEDVAAQVRAGIEEYKRTVEMENLRKKVADLEKEKAELEKRVTDPLNRIAGVLEPYAPSIVQQLFPQRAQVAGIPPADSRVDDVQAPAETIDLTDEQNERLSNALSVFAQHDADWLRTLERMAAKLQTNPQLISMIKNFL